VAKFIRPDERRAAANATQAGGAEDSGHINLVGHRSTVPMCSTATHLMKRWVASGVDAAVQEIEHISGQGDAWVQMDRELSREESLGHAYLAQPSGVR